MIARHLSALAAVALAGLATVAPAQAEARIKVGMLTCNVVGGVGYIVGSQRTLSCVYRSAATGKQEVYSGSITRVGLDIGAVNYTGLAWAVFAPASVSKGALSGGYVGASAEATVGLGVGANALIGGFGHSIVLNPLSVQAQTGVNIAAGIAGLSLTAVR